MDIKHPKIFDTQTLEEHYSEKDGVPVQYVCTTDLTSSDKPADIFYRDTPHPEFGNRYFGLYWHNDDVMITDADIVETFDFGMIKDNDGSWFYSSSHHDCIFVDGKMIDGGRAYIRTTGLDGTFNIVNGKFVEKLGV